MTFIFGSWTVGAALLFSAIKNMSLLQLAKGETGPGQPASIVDSVKGAAGVSMRTGGTTAPGGIGSENVKGLGIWTNPDGSKVPVCKWIIGELRRAGAHPHIESGYRSNADQARACAETSGPCAEPGKSNHQGKRFPKCAIDVRSSDVAETDKKLKRVHSKLKYAGAKDPVHFSYPHGGSY
jgi:hypothetical protein